MDPKISPNDAPESLDPYLEELLFRQLSLFLLLINLVILFFDQLIISEIKQNKYNPKSDFIRILRNLKIQEMRFSKYCMGLLHVNNNLKYNRFKPRLIQINKILAQS